MVRPSGLTARELPPFRMALDTECVEKGLEFLSSGHFLLSSRLTLRVFGSDLWGTIEN